MLRCPVNPGLGDKTYEEPPHGGRGMAEGKCNLSHISKACQASTGREGRPSASPVLRGAVSDPQATATRLRSGQCGADGGHWAGRARGQPELPPGSRAVSRHVPAPPQVTAHLLCDREPRCVSATAASPPAWAPTAAEGGRTCVTVQPSWRDPHAPLRARGASPEARAARLPLRTARPEAGKLVAIVGARTPREAPREVRAMPHPIIWPTGVRVMGTPPELTSGCPPRPVLRCGSRCHHRPRPLPPAQPHKAGTVESKHDGLPRLMRTRQRCFPAWRPL